jgi:hypothetical protein
VSPDSRSDTRFDELLNRAVRRARLVGAAEAAAIGAAAATISVVAGLLTALLVALWRSRRASRAGVVRKLERFDPACRNVLVTADEIAAGRLSPPPFVRQHVQNEAAVRLESIDVTRALSTAALAGWTGVAAASWLLVAGVTTWRGSTVPGAFRLLGRGATARAAQPISSHPLHVSVRVEPPTYTAQPPVSMVDPVELTAIEGSTARLSIESDGARVSVEHDGATRTLARGADGRFAVSTTLTRSGYVLVSADDGSRRMMPATVTPDALPTVRLATPGRDLVYDGGNPRIEFAARATDDFGLESLALRFTRVSGSGEQFSFTEGDIPLTITKTNARDWHGSASRSLADLGLKDGDMLVYHAEAADARPGDGRARSDAFFIEISRLGVAAGDAFSLPDEETRYALSQQMLIVKTERLNQRRGRLPVQDFAEASINLAVEQRMIRAELVFMLGGEVENEETEAEQSTELQEGRLANRGQRDLREATVAMSRVEKLLTGANTADALPAEHAAVNALQRAFTRDRYILRALASRSQLDWTRRLTGAASQAIGWRRQLADVPANRRAAALRSLLEGLGDLARRARGHQPGEADGIDGIDDRAAIGVLAELAVRVGSESAVLRQVAADLQRLADGWDTLAAADRTRRLTPITAIAALEARRSLADPPADVGSVR